MDRARSIETRSTRLRRLVPAPRARIYRTMLDPAALPRWKVPEGMDLEVHQWEPREGGRLRISLSYRDLAATGKTTLHTDTYHGQFVRLIPNELIVERDEFEADDPALRGAMTITIALADAEGGTELVATHAGVPAGVSLADNETGWRMALDKLTALVCGP
ncbi:MAG: SRPBCC domain-containing protein [Gemmatimonadaceae bacterium]